MKINALKLKLQQANTLVVTVVIIAVCGFMLAAYLKMVKVQNYNTVRSQAWNSAVPVIEAGIEDAMTHMNIHTNTLATDGWFQSGGIYWTRRNVPEGYYIVSVSNWIAQTANNIPVIESRGYVNMPYLVASVSAMPQVGPFLATLPTSDLRTSVPVSLARGVRVRARLVRLFTKALVANGQIDLMGNNVFSDSFDSSDPNYSTDGKYDPLKHKAGGDIATNSGLTNSLGVGNADIMGKISTGPGGSISIGPNGIVGGLQWFADNRRGIQPGWSTDDMNVDYPDVDYIPTGGVPPIGGTNGYTLAGGNYVLPSLNLSGSQKLAITGPTTLYIEGDLTVTGGAGIEVQPGGSLQLYVAGRSTSIGGNGVANLTGNAVNFQYWGLPSNTSLSFSGNSSFIGTIYAPSAHFQLTGGGGSAAIDWIGACIVGSANLKGNYSFHYDEALTRLGPFKGYVAVSWDEMTPQEVAQSPLDGGTQTMTYRY